MTPMKVNLSIVILLMACCLGVKAQNVDSTATMHEVIVDHLSLFNDVHEITWRNPAMMEGAHTHSLTHFYLGADWKKNSAPLVLQKGTGHFKAAVSADSYIRLGDNTAVWGKASYSTGTNHGIKWNSVADYDLLEPDILGDTIGGNTRNEKYVFEGGYSTHRGRWHMGGEMLFRAEQEYRKVDPRMRSIVSDLTLRAGAGYDIAHYTLGFGFQGNIYRQTNNVDFYKPLGSIPEYQLMGLGEVYTRFSGDINDLIFKGGGVKLQLDFTPQKDCSGALVAAWASQHSYERVARLLNSLPLTTLYNKEVGIRAGWMHNGELDYALWGDYQFNRRSSDQHLAGTSSSQIYPVIAHLTMYKNYIINTSLTAMVGHRGTTSWWVKASGGYIGNRQHFVFPRRVMKYGHIFGKVEGQVILNPSKLWTITTRLNGSYHACVNDNLLLPLADMEPYFIDMIEHNFNVLKSNFTHAGARLRADYHIGNSRYSIFGEMQYGITLCSNHEIQNHIVFSLGVHI